MLFFYIQLFKQSRAIYKKKLSNFRYILITPTF